MGIFGNKNPAGDSATSSLSSSKGKSRMLFWIGVQISLVCITIVSYYFYKRWKKNKEIEAINQGTKLFSSKEIFINETFVADIEDRTRELFEENFDTEPDISTDCKVFDKSDLIEEETVDIVPDSDPDIAVYITSVSWVNQF